MARLVFDPIDTLLAFVLTPQDPGCCSLEEFSVAAMRNISVDQLYVPVANREDGARGVHLTTGEYQLIMRPTKHKYDPKRDGYLFRLDDIFRPVLHSESSV
jgi:hypothetical protein